VDFDPQGVKDFLTLLLFRHVSVEIPVLLEYRAADFEQYLISEIFGGLDAYVELVRASEGNPRDFLSLLDQCLSRKWPDLETKSYFSTFKRRLAVTFPQ
jgi:hypothetical protein